MGARDKKRDEKKKFGKISDAFSHRRACHNAEMLEKKAEKQDAHLLQNKHRYKKSCVFFRELKRSIYAMRSAFNENIIRLDIFRIARKFPQWEIRSKRTFIN